MNEVIDRPQAATPALRSEAESLTQAIITIARDPALDIEKMERLMAMHERITSHSNEQRFNEAMAQAQSRMGRISADAVNPQTRSRYATYAQLDRVVRPIYTECGFSLSFDQGDGAPENHVRVLCYVSNAGHTRTYRCDMPSDGKGARGNDVMTKTHASGAAMSYGMRYLLKLIFNLAIGEDDDDGNSGGASRAEEWCAKASSAETREALSGLVKEGVKVFQNAKDRDGYAKFAAAVQARGAELKES